MSNPVTDLPVYGLTWITEHIAVGSMPISNEQYGWLKEQGLDAIMNLCGEFCGLTTIQQDLGFEVYHLPIPDEEAPDQEDLEAALSWLDEAVYLDKKVLIH
jgi:protein-tyrosine phosphatase